MISREETAKEKNGKRIERHAEQQQRRHIIIHPVKRNYVCTEGGGGKRGYLHRARIQSDTMDHFNPNVSLFCSRGRRNEKHHLAILAGWRASPER